MTSPLLSLRPRPDLADLRRQFDSTGRAQVADVLTPPSAEALRAILKEQVPWGIAWQAAGDGPHYLKAAELDRLRQDRRIPTLLQEAKRSGDYSFLYASYPLVTSYLEGWSRGSVLDRLLEELNAGPFLDLLRGVSGCEIVKADGQATLYAAGHYLARHDDEEAERGRQVAYVLHLTDGEWLPEWGGYLHFYDEALEIERGMKPRFNSLHLFKVPQLHSVAEVVPGAPAARFAITGWGRSC